MYPTDLTDSQWEIMKDILDDQRKRKYSLRAIINGIFYLNKSGCQWRLLPKEYPPYRSVYYYLSKWIKNGTLERINKSLNQLYRKEQGKEESPSTGIIDSQTVKSSEWGVPEKGFDGNKKINGRKRHIVVDTIGCVLAVVVHAANQHDSKGARLLFKELFKQNYKRLITILADGAYRGEIRQTAAICFGWMIQIFTINQSKNFQVIPQRWKVERNFAWLTWNRRLSKDYECEPKSAAAFVYISNIQRIIKKI